MTSLFKKYDRKIKKQIGKIQDSRWENGRKLPVKKEGKAKGIRLELSSADWMGDEVPVFCTA